MYLTKAVFLYYLCGCYIFIWQWGGTGSVYLGYVFMSMKILLLIGYKAGLYDIMDAICMVWCRENSMKTGRNGE
jgi:hypothetical protein